MLKFTTRANILGFLYCPIPIKMENTSTKSISNYEKYCIIQMENQYAKLAYDVIYIGSIEYYTDYLKEQQDRLSYELIRLANIKKDYTQLARQLHTPPHFDVFDSRVEFFQARLAEQDNYVTQIRQQIKNLETNLFALLYRPLIHCIGKIIQSCIYDQNWRKYKIENQQDLNLTKIIQIILVHSNVVAFEKQKYIHNIYSFPLISRMEDYCSKAILADASVTVNAQVMISEGCKRFLNSLEERYLLIICQKIAHFLNNDENIMPEQTRMIWDMNGLGKNIFSFLLSEVLVQALFARYAPVASNGKRKFHSID